MGNLHIVTGYKGENHVTAADIASFQASIFGTGEYVLNRGNKFSTTVVSNNQIRVADGDILMQGRHIRMNEGTYVDLTIENGSQGYFRNDLIVARYTKDSTTGVEDCNLVVIKGTAVSADPVDPEYTTGDIIEEHVLLNDMPLYRIPLDGLNVGTLVPLWTEASITVSPASIGAVPATRTINGKALSSNITLNASDVSAIPTSEKAAANGVATLDANGKVTAQQAASFMKQITSTTYTLTEEDAGMFINVSNGAGITITIPTMDDVPFPRNTEIEFFQQSAGVLTFVPADGVTLWSLDSMNQTAGRYAVVCLKKIWSDTWLLAGALA